MCRHGNPPCCVNDAILVHYSMHCQAFQCHESVRTLVEMHVLVGERGHYRLAQDMTTLHVPATGHGVLAARIDRLMPEEAEEHYPQAFTRAEELGMRPLQAHCHLGLDTLYARSGQREQGRDALSAAVDLYRAMDMAFWLPQAEAALVQLGRR